jgi:Flp pilus assembly protein TadD
MLICLTAAAFASPGRDAEVLARAQQLQLQFRQGNLRSVDPLVSDLETAVGQSPDNADLWEALGNAYMSQQGLLYQSQPAPGLLLEVGERARAAYERALALDKGNALLLASHGMAGMSTAMLKQDPAALRAAIEEMNSAVRQAPGSTPVRLTRGFTIIHLPIGSRDTAAVTADLKFVMNATTRRRPEDVLHVLLGDVYAETGQLEQARREYEQVTGASSFAAEQSRARLEDLKKGAVSPAAIAQVRAGTGYRCVMCHAPGTDD